MRLGWFNQIHIVQYIGTFLSKPNTKKENKVTRPF